MRRCCGLAAAALIGAGGPGGLSAAADTGCLDEAAEARAAEVMDARSLKLRDGRVVRLAGIEPFDMLRPSGSEAETALRRRIERLVATATLSVQPVAAQLDRYGRLPAMITADGALMQEALAEAGLAVAFAGGEPLPCFQRILAAEERARRARRGFWDGTPRLSATPAALAPHVGHFVIFEGPVLSVGNRRTRTYLNFGRRWREDVTVEIAAADRRLFGGEAALAALTGRLVRVRGFLEEKSGPMMTLRSPMQLEVIDAETGGLQSGP